MPDNTRVSPARAAAVRILMDCLEGKRPIHNLPSHQWFRNLEGPDIGLASEIIYGVLRNLLRCEYLVQCHTDTDLARLDPEVVTILRASVYQLDFMAVPEYAVVDEAVELTRFLGKSSAAGFVNGVLRSFLRQRHPLPAGNSLSSLSIRYSHPRWLVRRYISRYGLKAARKLMARNNLPPDSCLRINTVRISTDDFLRRLEAEEIPYTLLPDLPACLKVGARGFNRHRLYTEGYSFYMNHGSQKVAAAVEVEPGMRIGDFCAAPGGKSFILASRTGPGGLVLALDVSRSRLLQMKQRMELYGVGNCLLGCADLEKAGPPARGLDAVLLDVPCSGIGTIRSNPDIRWIFREEDLPRQQARQAAILRNGFRCLDRKQKLFYTTCSTEPEENEEVIRGFLRDEPGAELAGEPFHTLSYQDHGEGFFVAAIRRT